MEPTRTRLSVTTCTLVSRFLHLYTHATSNQSYVQGDKHLDLPDTTIHGVTEQTRPDMLWLHFRCPMRRKIYTFGRRPATRKHVAGQRYQSVRLTEPQSPILYPFPTSREALVPNYTIIYGGKTYSMTSTVIRAQLPPNHYQSLLWKEQYVCVCPATAV